MKSRLGAGIICILGLVFLVGTLPVAAAGAPDKILIGATVSQTGHFSSEIGPFKRLMEA